MLDLTDTPTSGKPDQTRPSRPVDPTKLVLFPARVFLALGWIRAGVEKVIDQSWWSGDYVIGFLGEQETTMLAFLSPIASRIDTTAAMVISPAVVVTELAIGVCLLTARSLRPALWTACLLNASFVALGAVTPSAFYLVIQLTLLLGLANDQPAQSRRVLSAIIASTTAAILMLPFVRTLHPHAVIEDPAIMLATLSALISVTLTIQHVEQTTRGNNTVAATNASDSFIEPDGPIAPTLVDAIVNRVK